MPWRARRNRKKPTGSAIFALGGAAGYGGVSVMRLYSDLAHLWPLVSPPEDYAEEAAYWRDALRFRLGPGRHRLLELGVGGGHNLSHLTSEFEAVGVDLSPQMLNHSRRLNPEVRHHIGDMRTVRLGESFDAVLIHDAVSYMLTEDDLRATFGTARTHLRHRGLLLVMPDLIADSFIPGRLFNWDIPLPSDPDAVSVRVEEFLTDPDPTDTTIESRITIYISEGEKERVETDVHVTGLFPLATWLDLLDEAGFDTEVLSLPGDGDGCGEHLLVGRLR